MRDLPQEPLPPNRRRQAAHVIGAFRFQLLETAVAWLNLPEAATLLIEIFEDFDIQTASGSTELTQVKHSTRDRTLTLGSKDTRDALENFWATSREGTVPNVSLVIQTNMEIGTERGADLPGGTSGITYWQAAHKGADVAPLRDLLLNTLPDGKLRSWLDSNPDEDALRSRLIERVSWRTSQPSGAPQSALLTELIAGRLAALELPVGLAPSITAEIVEHVFSIASETDTTLRRLTAADLHRILHEAARPGQPGHETSWTRSSWTASVEEIELPEFRATRAVLITKLSSILDESNALWLHGASGTGKSTLALQIARDSKANWLSIEFRDLTDPNEMLLRLNRAHTDIVLGGDILGVILDDVDCDMVARHLNRLRRFIDWMRERGGRVVITSARMLSPASFHAAHIAPTAATEAPYLSIAETNELVSQTNAPLDKVEAWGLFIHVAASAGHPQLTAAKVVSLNHRGWPEGALLEDLTGAPSEAIEMTRAEARRRLLGDATEHGRTLLKRLGCIMFKFDRPTAIAIAALAPSIKDPSESLDLLMGPWIEKVPAMPGYFRLSPLLSGLQEDLTPATIKSIQTGYLISKLQRGPIPYEELDSMFWTAFVAKQGWFISKLFMSSLSFDEDTYKAMAAKLGGLVYLQTAKMLLPEDPGTSHFLRLLQIDVAALNGERKFFQSIAVAAMQEAMAVKDEELRNALTLTTLLKILFAQGSRLDWDLRLSYLSFFEALAAADPDLMHSDRSPSVQAMRTEFGRNADVSGLMLQIGVSAIDSSAELRELFVALDRLEPELRTQRLSQLKAVFGDYSLRIQSAWANAWSAANLNVSASISDYKAMAYMAETWGDVDLVAECIVAQSVFLDEFQHDLPKALEIIETALVAMSDHPALLRQQAKVLGHDHQYGKARAILESISAHIDQGSNVERMYALREQAVAAANLGDLGPARRIFLEAALAAEEVQSEITSLRANGVALRAEAAICLWRNGDRDSALRELVPLINKLEEIDPDSDDAATALHLKLRWLVGWLYEATSGPTGLKRELQYGAIASLDGKYSEEARSQGANQEDIRLLLMIVGIREDLHDLFPDMNWSKTTIGLHIFLNLAELDLAIEEGAQGQIAHALIQLAATFSAAQKEKSGVPVTQIERIKELNAGDLGDPGVKAVLLHALALAAFFCSQYQNDKFAFCEALLGELKERLTETLPELDRWIEVLNGKSITTDPESATLIFVSALSPCNEVLHPTKVLHRQLSLLRCTAACGCGARMLSKIHTLFADEWDFVIAHQRFLLTQPSQHLLELQTAIDFARQQETGALATLLRAGARVLGSEIPSPWLDLAEKLGGKATKQTMSTFV